MVYLSSVFLEHAGEYWPIIPTSHAFFCPDISNIGECREVLLDEQIQQNTYKE